MMDLARSSSPKYICHVCGALSRSLSFSYSFSPSAVYLLISPSHMVHFCLSSLSFSFVVLSFFPYAIPPIPISFSPPSLRPPSIFLAYITLALWGLLSIGRIHMDGYL